MHFNYCIKNYLINKNVKHHDDSIYTEEAQKEAIILNNYLNKNYYYLNKNYYYLNKNYYYLNN